MARESNNLGLIKSVSLCGLMAVLLAAVGVALLRGGDGELGQLNTGDEPSLGGSLPRPMRGAAAPHPIATSPVAAAAARGLGGELEVEGLLTDPAGTPVVSGTVQLTPVAAPVDPGALALRRRAGPPAPLTVSVKAGGRFRFDGLLGGDYIVDAHDGTRSLAAPVTITVAASMSALDLRLVAGDVLEGRVHETDGTPVPDAAVAVAPRGRRDVGDPVGRRTVRTDAEGRYRVDGLRRGCTYRVEPTHTAMFYPQGRDDLLIAAATKLDVLLLRCARVEGVVRGPTGEPLDGALVEWRGGATVTSDAQGRFALVGLRFTETVVGAVRGLTKDLLLLGAVDVTVEPGSVRGDVVLQLQPCARVRGVVRDIRGSGVAETRVSARAAAERQGKWQRAPVAGIEVSGLGSPRFIRSAAGHVSLGEPSESLRADGLQRAFLGSFVSRMADTASAEAPQSEGWIDLSQWEHGDEEIQFRTVETGEHVVEVPFLRMRGLGDRLVLHQTGEVAETENSSVARLLDGDHSAPTDAEGRYEILGLFPGDYRVDAKKAGWFLPESVQATLAEMGQSVAVDLTLRHGASIAGEVILPDDHGEGSVVVELVSKGTPLRREIAHAAAVSGQRSRIPFAFDGLRAADYDVRVSALVGLVDRLKKLTLDFEEQVEGLVFEPVPGSSLLGRTVDASGKPVSGAKVQLGLGGGFTNREATTGDDGKYEFVGLYGDHPVTLEVEAPKGWVAPTATRLRLPTRGEMRQDVTLQLAMTLKGSVLGADGRATEGINLFLRKETDTDSVNSDSNGLFTFHNLAPGKYILYARTEDRKWSDRTDIVLEPGVEPIAIQLRMKPSPVVIGKLVAAEGVEFGTLEVTAIGLDNDSLTRAARCAADGTFRIEGLYFGSYRLRIGKKDLDVRFTARAPGEVVGPLNIPWVP